MHVFRDTASIRDAATQLPAIGPVIGDRLKELAEYAEDLSALVNVYVVEPNDSLADLDDALGFSVEERPHDVIGVHPACYELTYVLADDGFGVVVYVPRTPGIDPGLLELCATRATEHSP